MKTISNCCGCIVLLILLALAACAAWAIFLLSAQNARAQTVNSACAYAPSIEQAIEITPGVPPPAQAAIPRGVFFTKDFTLTLRGGECIAIASTRGAEKGFWVDDAYTIDVTRQDGSLAHATHDFRNDDHTRVIPLAPQDLSRFFLPGENRVRVTLQDLSPNVYGASALWLIVFSAPAPLPTNTAASAAIVATPAATPVVSVEFAKPAPAPSPEFNSMPLVLASLVAFALTATVVGIRVARQRAANGAPLHSGDLTLHNRRTFESLIVELADYPRGVAIYADPLRVEPLAQQTNAFLRAIPLDQGLTLHRQDASDEKPIVLLTGETLALNGLQLSLENETNSREV